MTYTRHCRLQFVADFVVNKIYLYVNSIVSNYQRLKKALRLKFLAPIDKSTKKEETIVEEDQVDSEERVQFHSILEKAGIIRQNGNSKPECDSGFNSQGDN